VRLLLLVVPAGLLATVSGDGLPGWAQVAIVLAGMLSIATKQLVPGWVYNELRVRLVGAEADNKQLTATLLDTQPKTVMALEASTRAIAEAMAEMRVYRERP